MNCKLLIKEEMHGFTGTQRRLASYLLNHSGEVIRMSAKEFAEACGASPAAVVRFSRKLGFKGFTDLKLCLAQETGQGEEIDEFQIAIRDNDDMEAILRKAECIHTRNISLTCRMINPATLTQAAENLRACRTIHLFGLGASGLLALDFLHKASRIGIPAFYHTDAHTNLATAALLTPEDAVIAISYSGETRETVLAARTARDRGCRVIAITKAGGNSLSRLAHYSLCIPGEERGLRVGAMTSRTSGLLVLDLLYLGIAKQDPERTEKNLRETRSIIQVLQGGREPTIRTSPKLPDV